MKRIEWKSRTTGAAGSGNPVEDQVADTWVEKLNHDFPEIEHRAITMGADPVTVLAPQTRLVRFGGQ
jgi:hypothetical protein